MITWGTRRRMKCEAARLFGYVTLCVASACSATAASPAATSGPDAATPTVSAAEPTASDADRRPVPARVADLHRSTFEPSTKPVPGGTLHCLITVHDGQLSHDELYAVALFGRGLVATWTQAPTGKVDSFLAQLTTEEYARALELLGEAKGARDAAEVRFAASDTVMGLSTSSGDRVETSYFASARTPEPLDGLVRLLKHRLEATNAR